MALPVACAPGSAVGWGGGGGPSDCCRTSWATCRSNQDRGSCDGLRLWRRESCLCSVMRCCRPRRHGCFGSLLSLQQPAHITRTRGLRQTQAHWFHERVVPSKRSSNLLHRPVIQSEGQGIHELFQELRFCFLHSTKCPVESDLQVLVGSHALKAH